MLGPESRDIGADFGIVPMAFEEFSYPGAGIAEQRSMDELDRRRRALDVEQDDADVLQLELQCDTARRGM